ncbi:tripartite ATP-independent transporter solute receptor, DctP family [Prauserella aidingensis]|uniref:TRAP transporter substrate-binding protein n=1 Tax=Prauserella aidingensis TaxID=387890 RepID=UPI0020A4BA22|nr:TRAP transporter substrate-binding protein [Prauserella aidingensis]MCP2253755.1 tripartite ATP-independent transporter solute receptor, DctP family [Prauserella aidingensis]
MRTQTTKAVIGGLVPLLLLAGCTSASDDGRTQLSLAVETSEGDPLADMLLTFADRLEETLGDQVSVTVQSGGATGDEEAVLQQLRAGSVDVAAVSGSVAGLDPIFDIMEVPFLFTDRTEATEFLDGEFGREMSESLSEEIGARVLAFGENGFRHITNNERPIRTPADLSGLKIRVPGSPARVSLFESLGAAPTQIDIGEAYLALDQGVLDGQENPLKVVDAFSFHEKQRYLSLTSHIYSPVYLTMNEQSWSGLPEDLRTGVEQAAADAAEISREAGTEADRTLKAKFEEQGMQINEADVDAFRRKVAGVREEIADGIPDDFADRVLARADD